MVKTRNKFTILVAQVVNGTFCYDKNEETQKLECFAEKKQTNKKNMIVESVSFFFLLIRCKNLYEFPLVDNNWLVCEVKWLSIRDYCQVTWAHRVKMIFGKT